MLIGISGKIGSGKDTVGKIIQYLLYMEKEVEGRYYPPDVFLEEISTVNLDAESKFTIKKFADKLKEMVCLLIGCTREDLEDQAFKSTELGEEWLKYEVVVNSHYTYFMRESIIAEIPRTHKYIIEDPEQISSILELHNKSAEESKLSWRKDKDSELVTTFHHTVTRKPLTPRLLLQLLGTECIRNKVNPNAWVNALFADYKYKSVTNCDCDTISSMECMCGNTYPDWIITDVRYPNELEAIKKRGGTTIRVDRAYSKDDLCKGSSRFISNPDLSDKLIERYQNLEDLSIVKEHDSEIALDNADFDYYISNNGTLEDLIHSVRLILKRQKNY